MREKCPEEPVDLEALELERAIAEELLLRGYRRLTPPQAEAIRRGLLDGRSLLVSAPTASGKTLIAEMVLAMAALQGGIGIYTCPLKALASEKYREFKRWERVGIRVGISTGDYDSPGEELGRYGVLVTTYERLDSIFRHRPEWIDRVRSVVVDEIHEIGDPERGPIIEMIVARARLIKSQILGLSATIGNPEELASWIGGDLVECSWRPVPLVQGYYDRARRRVFYENGASEQVGGDVIMHFVARAFNEDQQLLIFRQSRREAEATARRISEGLGPVKSPSVEKLVAELRDKASTRYEYEALSGLMARGVAYHHAGLSQGSREVVEKGFRERILKVVVSTPTLAAGVNLPARRVLITTRRFSENGYEDLSVIEYKQMAGRAGRPQYDKLGEAIIIDRGSREAERYIRGPPEAVGSAFSNERSLRIHVLASIASGYASRREEILDIFTTTFYGHKWGRSAESSFTRTLEQLKAWGMVLETGERLRATSLGIATSMNYLDPLSAKRSLDLMRTRGEEAEDLWYLHLIAYTPDLLRSFTRRAGYRSLEEEAYKAFEAGVVPPLHEDDYSDDEWLIAYKAARILNMWIDERDEDEILDRHGIMPGDLRTLVETAAWVSHAISAVASTQQGLRVHSKRLEKISKRIESGVREELLPLVAIRGIGRVRARALYEHGIRSPEDILKRDPRELLRLRGFNESVVKQIYEQLGRGSEHDRGA